MHDAPTDKQQRGAENLSRNTDENFPQSDPDFESTLQIVVETRCSEKAYKCISLEAKADGSDRR